MREILSIGPVLGKIEWLKRLLFTTTLVALLVMVWVGWMAIPEIASDEFEAAIIRVSGLVISSTAAACSSAIIFFTVGSIELAVLAVQYPLVKPTRTDSKKISKQQDSSLVYIILFVLSYPAIFCGVWSSGGEGASQNVLWMRLGMLFAHTYLLYAIWLKFSAQKIQLAMYGYPIKPHQAEMDVDPSTERTKCSAP